VAIAHVGEDECRKALLDIDTDDVQAIVQTGTELIFLKLVAEAER